MDKSMIGDGAVIREWAWHEPHSNPQSVQHIQAGDKQLWGPEAVSEHNAAIQRLTDRALTAEANYAAAVAACNSRAASDIASEARTADLLKALERIAGSIYENRRAVVMPPTQADWTERNNEVIRLADIARSAAKGGTV